MSRRKARPKKDLPAIASHTSLSGCRDIDAVDSASPNLEVAGCLQFRCWNLLLGHEILLSSSNIIMDADISDILASVSRPSIPQATLDLQALTRAWVNERTSPELLPYPAELVDRVMDRVKKQVGIDKMTYSICLLPICKRPLTPRSILRP